jgi:hypothetical protein
MADSTATLSVNISNSLLTTVTWTASYATITDTWSAKTQIATGTFTVTSTLTNYNAQISIPAAATTGIEILFTVGAQTSGTWVIGNIQLEKGSTATSFDYRSIGDDLDLCQRYFLKTEAYVAPLVTGVAVSSMSFAAQMRTSPTVSGGGTGFTVVVPSSNQVSYYKTAASGQTLSFNSEL